MQKPAQTQSYLCDPPQPSPPHPVCWRICLFSISPHHHHHPLFPFQSLTKNFFSSFYKCLPPHICTSITRPGNGESCDLHRELLPGRRKRRGRAVGRMNITTLILPQLWGQRSPWCCSSAPNPQKSWATFTLSFPFICLSARVFLLFWIIFPPVLWLLLDPHVSLRSLRFTVIIVYTSVASKSKQNIKPFATTRLSAGHWVFQELCLSAGEKWLKKRADLDPRFKTRAVFL